eukprot:gnl/TRDRNA2_/TRDRNA2_173625_c1_seq1.p1 gnl/TRDRNA2_/TRDRNA2_173625_c1~~gnl/TRDRNA2_/TRDRNA2_173625_c1_seq1.p1  ORF type:complete len:253 (+),score=36.28 gnl/TRDRNA2_/TRDRNA2_173625_c1_seq1:73-831(+)
MIAAGFNASACSCRVGSCKGNVYVDIGALCLVRECLLADLMRHASRRGSKCRKDRVFGFEPNAHNLRRTRMRLAKLVPRRWFRGSPVMLMRMAVSNVSMPAAPLFGAGAKASLKASAYGGLSWMLAPKTGAVTARDSHLESVPVIRLADWASTRRPPIHEIELLKVDVEGAEWEVLLGAQRLLSAQQIKMVVLEYSHFWAAGWSRESGQGPSLRSVAERLASWGYDGYFIGTRCLVPFSGGELEWWNELREA